MANLTPTPSDDDVWQWDGTTPLVGGGSTAPLNRQAQALLNKLLFVKDELLSLINDGFQKSFGSLSVSVSASAMTGSLAAEKIEFRSTSIGNGTPVSRTTVSKSLTVPSGATLGAVSGQPARIAWGWLDDGAVLEPFVINVSAGVNLDETALISTTAISASSNSAGVFYSQGAHTNAAFRIRGFCDITQATAGTHISAPIRVQPAGGQSLTALSLARSWKNVLAARTFNVTYYNNTGRDIAVSVNIVWVSGAGSSRLVVNGVPIDGPVLKGVNETSPVVAVVPDRGSYVLQGTNSIGFTLIGWNELS